MEKETFYSSNHLWFERDGAQFKVGVTKTGYDEVGEIMWMEWPSATTYRKGETLFSLETSKSVVEIAAPMALTVSELNDTYGIGDDTDWIFRASADDVSELMNAAEYKQWKEALK